MPDLGFANPATRGPGHATPRRYHGRIPTEQFAKLPTAPVTAKPWLRCGPAVALHSGRLSGWGDWPELNRRLQGHILALYR
jgi:hypothetical protein